MTCGASYLVTGGDPVPTNSDFIGYSGPQTPAKTYEPTVDLTVQKSMLSGVTGFPNVTATISYDFKRPAGNLYLYRKAWTDADGTTHPEVEVARWMGRSNTLSPIVMEVPRPSGSQQFTLIVKAEACGTTTDEASIGCDGAGCCSLDPVYFTNGNVRVTDADPLPPIGNQRLVRTYNSDEQVIALFGRGFTTLFERRLMAGVDNGETVVSVVTAENEVVTFRGSGSAFRQTWPSATDTRGTLRYDSVSATYSHRAARSTEVAVFRASDGGLIALRDVATGREAQITYDALGLPQALTDSWSGTGWNLTYDAPHRRIASITVSSDPALVWSYSYDTAGNLTTVTAPQNATWRTYEYAANRMTASYDAAGKLIEGHSYDANGYGTSSTGPNDEIDSIVYGLSGANSDETVTQVTYKTGAIATYSLRRSGGSYRPVMVNGGCASCGAREVTYVRDGDGRAVREQDMRGYVVERTYDPVTGKLVRTRTALQPSGCDPATDSSRCRQTTEGLSTIALLPTRATLTTDYQYGDTSWPDRPTFIVTESIAASGTAVEQSRTRAFAYDPLTGTTLSQSATGWSGGVYATRTTTTALYNGTEAAAFAPAGSFVVAWLTLQQPGGRPKSTDGPRTDADDITQFVYYPIDSAVPALLRGQLAATKNAAGHISRFENYDVFGNVLRSTDANAVASEFTYDTLGRLLTSTVKAVPGCAVAFDEWCATDITHVRTYASAGPLVSETLPRGGRTTYAYDSRGRVQSVTRGQLDEPRERIEYGYDPLTGNKSLERTLARKNGSWVEKTQQSFTYDALGRLTRTTHPAGEYVQYAYDAADQMVSVRDENHTTAPLPNTRYTYGPSGLLEQVTQALAGTPNGVVSTTYSYDVYGNLVSVTDPNGNVTAYVYDDFDQLAQTVSPVTGTTAYVYDAAGQLVSTTDANGAMTTRTYDALGRVAAAISTRAGAAGETVTWTYDEGTFGIGRLTGMVDPAGETRYAYERRGLLREEVRSFPNLSHEYTTRYTYNRDGNRKSVVYPSTLLTVTYTSDHAGRPTAATGIIAAAEYLPFGPLTRLQFANGLTQKFEFDSRYRMTRNELAPDTAPNTPVMQHTYGYDPAGNVISIADGLDTAYSRTFEYDDLNRLVTANTGSALWGKGQYVWDAMGNLISYELGKVEPADPGEVMMTRRKVGPDYDLSPRGRRGSFQYLATTPLLEAVTTNDVPRTVQYDAAGNETSFFATRTYSARNLMQEITDLSEPGEPLVHKTSYAYDGRGIRSIQTESPSAGAGTAARRFYLYTPELRLLSVTDDDGANVWSLQSFSDGDKGVRYEIVWFGDRPVAQVTPAGPTLFTIADHLGTPILQTDSARNLVWHAEYEPFGNVYEMRGGTRTEQPLRFPGQEVASTWEGQEENYNIFRWYRSGWGRYTQADPMGLSPGSSTNLSGYVDARPIVATDRLGLVTSQAGCPQNACCTMQAMQQEFEKAWNYALTHQKDYDLSVGSLCSGQSCYDSANLLHKDIEQLIKPKCWITSTQLTKGGFLGKGLNPITKLVFGMNVWVHYVVKFTPCNASLPSKYIDLYTHPNYGVLSPSEELESP